MEVRKSIPYREITLAVGILVALLIALIYWSTSPDNETYGSKPMWQINLPPSIETRLVQTAFTIFPALTKEEFR